ncbi:MAG TPA: hypothetical protein VNJ31_09725 [Methyloceanibacter sp.]|nr:hypothetical protein [Methyloceanibacter sp.]
MKLIIAFVVPALMICFGALAFGARSAEAAENFCKRRYNICLARCPGPAQTCLSRCQARYKGCISRRPYLGDLI